MEGAIRNGPKRYTDAHMQLKGLRGIAAASKKTAITANAKSRGMPEGGAVTYAPAGPEWGMLDEPPDGKPPPWMPPGGTRSGAAGG